MSPDQIELLKTAARNVIAARDAGSHCDSYLVQWAEIILTQNPHPTPQFQFDDDDVQTLPQDE